MKTTSAAYQHLRNTILRGGRMTKLKGLTASVAPMIGAAAAPVLMAGAISMGATGAAWAVNECGTDAVGQDTLTCAGGAYPAEIRYNNSDGLTLDLNDATITVGGTGVSLSSSAISTGDITVNGSLFDTISTTAIGARGIFAQVANTSGMGAAAATLESGAITTTGADALGVFAINRGGGAATVQMDGGTISTSGDGAEGLRAWNTGTGDAIITIGGTSSITTTGLDAIAARALITNTGSMGAVSVTMTGGTISTGDPSDVGLFNSEDKPGEFSDGLRAETRGLGSATVTMSGGAISTYGHNAMGAYAWLRVNGGNESDAVVDFSGGTIETLGGFSHGLFARTDSGLGDAIVMASNGTISTNEVSSRGVFAFNDARNAAADGDVLVTLENMAIVTNGRRAEGVLAVNEGLGVATINVTGGSISTNNVVVGDPSVGVYAQAAKGDASITVDGTVIETLGAEAHGVLSESLGSGNAEARLIDGEITTAGDVAVGLYALTSGGGATLAQMDAGAVTTGGFRAFGVYSNIINGASTATATALLNDGDIVTTGDVGVGLYANTSGLGETLAQMDGGTVTTDGRNAYGVYSNIVNKDTSTATATALLTAGDIVTTGDVGVGVYANTSALGATLAQMDGGTVTTVGVSAYGLYSNITKASSMATATALLTDGDIVTIGDAAHGLYALTSGSGLAVVTATGGTVSASGADAHGAAAVSAAGGTQVLIDTEVTGGSGTGYGVFTQTALDQMSTITIDSNAVLSAASGLAIFNNEGDSTTQIIAGASVSGEINLGDGDDLLTIDGVDINNITVMDGGDDIFSADGFIDVLTISDVTVTNTQTWRNWEVVNLDDVVLGDLNTCNGALTLGGASSAANVYGCIESEDFTVADTAEITGVLEGAGGADLIAVLDGASVATINGGGEGSDMSAADDAGDLIIIDTTGTIATVMGGDDGGIADGVSGDLIGWLAGTITDGIYGGEGSDFVLVSAAEYDGTQILDGGDGTTATDGMVDTLGLLEVEVEANGADILNWEVVSLDGSTLTILDGAWAVGDDTDPTTGVWLAQGSVLDGGAALALTGNLQIADATSSFQGLGAGAGVYEITGTLTNNGTVSTQDGAVGDMITVGGDYTGMGQLLVDIETGTDAADTLSIAGDSSGMTGIVVNNLSPNAATGNDILLVSVAGTSVEGDFGLVGGPVIAGAFQYDLEYQTGDFVLAAMLSSTGAVYEATPHVLLDGFTRMPTLEQRVGQRRWNSAAGTLEPTSGGWVRLSGDWSDGRLDTGTSYDANSWGLQAGFDLPVERGENGQWVLGLTAQTGKTSAGITTMTGTGSVSAESLGVGATATWYGTNDLYVDLQGQVNWAEVDYASSLHGTLAEGELARTAAASIEVGRRFALDENSGLIPQAQLTWASVEGGSFTDSAGNAVDMGSNDRVTGRLGLAYDYEWRDEDQGSMQNVYAIANILHDFSSDASVDVAGASLASDRDATWGEIGLGGSVTWNETTTLYGEASYREAFGSSGNSALSATAGLRIQW